MDLLRFGLFELDEAAGELWKDGRKVRLGGQPLKVLAFLAARTGEVVTREALRRHLWPEGVYVEFDTALNFCIRQVRRALGDDARSPRFIETLPRRGYRFLAAVERRRRAGDGIAATASPRLPLPVPPRARPILRALAAAAALALVVTRVGDPPRQAHTRKTAAPAALAEFEGGLNEYGHGSEGQRRSIRRFQAAVRIDPRFAEAHYALADTYLTLGERGVLPAAAAFPAALESAQRAVALEDDPATRLVLAFLRYSYHGDWHGAAAEFERALALAPDSDVVLMSYARFLSASGRDQEAMQAIDRAETLSPGCDLVTHESGWVRLRARRYDEAIRKFREAVRLGPPRGQDPSDWARYNMLMVMTAHLGQGNWEEAKGDAREIRRLVGIPEERLRQGDAMPARPYVELFLRNSIGSMARRAEQEFVPAVRFAEMYALLGEQDAALEWLERAAGQRDPTLAYSLRNRSFDDLRAQPRFRRLASRAGLLPAA